MSYLEKIQQIDKLRSVIESHGPIASELLDKINYKFRLEWNYTSNNMEGNRLTRRETRTIMVNLVEVRNKPIKDVMEMHNHDVVISNILKIGKGDLNLSENRIKAIHKAIMYEKGPENEKYAGAWRNINNYILNSNKERFDFVPHGEVQERMHDLMNWVNKEKEKMQRGEKDALHPVLLSFKFQLDYLTIHPFYDGNGRTARILSNLILISYGYPPVYIKEDDDEKEQYYQYLTDIQSYGGEPDLFYEFMARLLKRSMRIVIDAIEGRGIEDRDDVLKEIDLWKAQLELNEKGVEAKTGERIVELYNESFMPLLLLFKQRVNDAFGDLFANWQEWYFFNGSGQQEGINQFDEKVQKMQGNLNSFGLSINMGGFKRNGLNAFSQSISLMIEFDSYKYAVRVNRDIIIEKLYSEKIDSEGREEIVLNSIKDVFEAIKASVNPPKN